MCQAWNATVEHPNCNSYEIDLKSSLLRSEYRYVMVCIMNVDDNGGSEVEVSQVICFPTEISLEFNSPLGFIRMDLHRLKWTKTKTHSNFTDASSHN